MKHLQILQNTKNIRKKAQGICFFAVIGLSTLIFQFSCGGKVITEIQTYKANLPPEIVVFTSDSPGGATLLPNQVFHVHVEAMDPNEGNKISFKFDSKIGSFSGQSDTETTSDVVFTLPGILSAGFTAIATVTVTDQKGASSAKDLDLGSGRTGPLITVNTGVVTYPYLKDTDCTSVGWSADADGFFQVNLLKDINASCAVDTSVSGNFKFYTKNTPIEVFVHGINGKSSCHAETVASVYTPLTNGKANNDQNYKLCLVTRDALAQDSFISYNYTLDNVPPVTTPTPLIASQTFKAVPSTVLNCADALSPCKDVSYTVDYTSATQVSPAGITPNFAGIGTVMNYTSNVSPVFPVGSQGDGAYRFNFISRDAAGNQEVSSSVFWMNAISPVVTAAAPSHAVLTTTGNIAFQRSDIVWSSNDLGTFQVLINPTNAVNPCNSGGTQVSAGTLTGINQNITSSILATDLPNEGANTIYICINDGFTDAWASKTIKRDNTPPLQSTTFGPGTFSASPTGTFSCTDSNACSIAYSVAFNADTQTAPAAAALAFPGTLTGPTSSMITLGTADGTYTIQYQAVDEVGNISIAPATLSLSLDAVAPTITQGVSVLQVTSTGAVSPVNNASIDWSTNQNSSYYVMQGAACGGTTLGATNITAGGTSVSGTVSGATITSILNAPTLTPALTAGSNTVNICVFDGFTTATKAVTVVLDNTAAVTSVSPNIHNGNFQLAQSVTFNCSDIATGNSGCNGIRYIESNPPNTLVSGTFPAGTTPTFTAATIGATPGTGTGTLINSGAAVSLGALGDGKYTTTFVSLDNVGNVEAVKTINYTIDSTLPALTLVTPFTNSVVTTTGAAAYNTSSITWSSSVDANYYILINPPAGGAGSCTSGGGLTGGATIAATTNVTTTVTASAAAPSPWINGQN
ncbi:MAG: hypothetical protein OEV66_09870, partial [Spirochaetia bacterium]|nr:hypothetical protein [Spirochaetia bacterium]